MNLFVNDIPIRILKPGQEPPAGHINFEIDAAAEALTKAKLFHHVWLKNLSIEDFNQVLDLITTKVPTNLFSVYVSVADYGALKQALRNKYKIVKAAGGLVRKKDKVLMIYRMKKWDLPKGKKESGERYRQTAVREVEEECNMTVKIGKRICTTWHTYTMNKNSMLKKTRWFVMDVVDDSRSKPSLEEDIEELRWMTQKEVYHALENSYKSIRFVFEEYYRKTEKVS
ncbi:MAG: NUDIX domain-containing protein [Cyclobacteriaceae bacterium]|nr:NUDIX domain-containing protein [Cytophagales bacterium]MBX2898264.1 NUDIX domain-containing protein [Cyclobacteriaceae bacterium]